MVTSLDKEESCKELAVNNCKKVLLSQCLPLKLIYIDSPKRIENS